MVGHTFVSEECVNKLRFFSGLLREHTHSRSHSRTHTRTHRHIQAHTDTYTREQSSNTPHTPHTHTYTYTQPHQRVVLKQSGNHIIVK